MIGPRWRAARKFHARRILGYPPKHDGRSDMNLTDRQKLIRDALLEFTWANFGLDVVEQSPSKQWARALAVVIDQAVPSLPPAAPTSGHLPGTGATFIPGPVNVVVNLDTFYEEVVIPSREAYMARDADRRRREVGRG